MSGVSPSGHRELNGVRIASGKTISTKLATIWRNSHVHADGTKVTEMQVRRSVCQWNLPWIGGAKQHLVGRTTGGVFKVICIKRLAAIPYRHPELVKSIVGAVWDPTSVATNFQTERNSSHSKTILHPTSNRITNVRIHTWIYG